MQEESISAPESGKGAKIGRGALQVVGGVVPFVGGLLSAIAGAWSEKDQEKVNRFFEHWVQMIKDELKEKEQTVAEVMMRLDLRTLMVGTVSRTAKVSGNSEDTILNSVSITCHID